MPALLRYLLLCLLFLLNSLVAQAQMEDIAADLSWGSQAQAPRGSRLAKIIQAGEWGATILRYKPRSGLGSEQYWLEQYDARMALRSRIEMAWLQESNSDLEDILSLHGQLYVLLSQVSPEGDLSSVYVRPLAAGGQVTDKEQLVAELPREEKYRRRQFDLEFSRDSSRILLYNQLPPEKDGPEKFTLRVFNERFQLLWSRDVVLPYRDQGFGIQSYQVDQEGNVFVLGRQRSKINSKLAQSHYVLLAYSNDGKEQITYELTIDNIEINNLQFKVANDGSIVCGGFYTAAGQVGSTGICHLQINPLTREADWVNLLPFPEDFLQQAGQSSRRQADPTLLNYKLRELTLRSDGGMVLVAEQFFRQLEQIPTYQGVQTTSMYHFNDIVVANVSGAGEYTWLRSIPKKQETADDGGAFSSFAQTTVQDRLYFLYNDHPANFSPNQRQQYNMTERESVISLTEIDRAGNQKTIPLFVNRDAGVIARPRLCRQIGARVMLVYGEDGRDYRLGLLRFE